MEPWFRLLAYSAVILSRLLTLPFVFCVCVALPLHFVKREPEPRYLHRNATRWRLLFYVFVLFPVLRTSALSVLRNLAGKACNYSSPRVLLVYSKQEDNYRGISRKTKKRHKSAALEIARLKCRLRSEIR